MSVSFHLGRFGARLAALAALALPLSGVSTLGCGATGPSNVSQGLRYSAGEPAYDQYFDALYTVQVQLGQAPQQEAALRQKLASAVGTDALDPEPLAAAVGKQTDRMQKAGLALSLSVSEDVSDPTAKIEVTAGLAEAKDQRIITAIQETAAGELALVAEMEKAKAAIAQLRAQGPALGPSIDQTFRKEGPSKKTAVRKNLDDGQVLVPLMEQRAEEVATLARKMIDGLVKVANTTPAAPPAPPPSATPPATGSGTSGGGKPGAPAKPPPTKAPKASDGFEP